MKIPTHEEVAHCAHQIWQYNGCSHGRDVEHWLEAEHLLATALKPEPVTTATHEAAPVFNESFRERAPAEAAVEQRHEARAPITPRQSAPKARPSETGKPLWQQPHSR